MESGFSSQAITSGAIQYGVPMKVFLRPTVLSNWALTPKSTESTQKQKHVMAWTDPEMFKKEKVAGVWCTEFDFCVLRQQHILPFDISVNDFMGMEVGKALRADKAPGGR